MGEKTQKTKRKRRLRELTGKIGQAVSELWSFQFVRVDIFGITGEIQFKLGSQFKHNTAQLFAKFCWDRTVSYFKKKYFSEFFSKDSRRFLANGWSGRVSNGRGGRGKLKLSKCDYSSFLGKDEIFLKNSEIDICVLSKSGVSGIYLKIPRKF